MASHAELVDRYQILRAKSRPIFNALAESLPKDAIGQVAGRLGILNGKEILLETEDEPSEVAMMIIHDCVRAGASASIRYGESSQAARIEQGGTPQLTREKIGRNDPCPCGSAKKYKKCCGKAVSR